MNPTDIVNQQNIFFSNNHSGTITKGSGQKRTNLVRLHEQVLAKRYICTEARLGPFSKIQHELISLIITFMDPKTYLRFALLHPYFYQLVLENIRCLVKDKVSQLQNHAAWEELLGKQSLSIEALDEKFISIERCYFPYDVQCARQIDLLESAFGNYYVKNGSDSVSMEEFKELIDNYQSYSFKNKRVARQCFKQLVNLAIIHTDTQKQYIQEETLYLVHKFQKCPFELIEEDFRPLYENIKKAQLNTGTQNWSIASLGFFVKAGFIKKGYLPKDILERFFSIVFNENAREHIVVNGFFSLAHLLIKDFIGRENLGKKRVQKVIDTLSSNNDQDLLHATWLLNLFLEKNIDCEFFMNQGAIDAFLRMIGAQVDNYSPRRMSAITNALTNLNFAINQSIFTNVLSLDHYQTIVNLIKEGHTLEAHQNYSIGQFIFNLAKVKKLDQKLLQNSGLISLLLKKSQLSGKSEFSFHLLLVYMNLASLARYGYFDQDKFLAIFKENLPVFEKFKDKASQDRIEKLKKYLKSLGVSEPL